MTDLRVTQTVTALTGTAYNPADDAWSPTLDDDPEEGDVGGDKFQLTKPTILWATNADESVAHTITIPSGQTVDGFAVASATVVVPTEETIMVVLSGDAYKQAGSDYVFLNYDAESDTDLTINLLSLW